MTIIPLPQTAMLDGATDPSTSTPISPWRPFSPRPRPPSPSYIVRSASPVKRPRPPIKYDSSDPDHISQAPLPAGRLRTPSPPPPPVKKLKPTGPPPLPEGPSTVQTLHVLLHPEHVEQNRPRRFFDYVRPRDTRKAQVVPSPGELRDILEKMKKVNEIWLRMMGEDETCLGCLAMWLKQFINNPKVFEGSVVPLLWVGRILFFLPSPSRMSSRLCLEVTSCDSPPAKCLMGTVIACTTDSLAYAALVRPCSLIVRIWRGQSATPLRALINSHSTILVVAGWILVMSPMQGIVTDVFKGHIAGQAVQRQNACGPIAHAGETGVGSSRETQ